MQAIRAPSVARPRPYPARAQLMFAARRRHQQSPEGRLDHRDRNQEFRRLRRDAEQRRVMDTSSGDLAPTERVCLVPQHEVSPHADDGNGPGHPGRDADTGERRDGRSPARATAGSTHEPSLGATWAPGIARALERAPVACCSICRRLVRLAPTGADRRFRVRHRRSPLRDRDRAPRGPPQARQTSNRAR
jgi:hypothetical protein